METLDLSHLTLLSSWDLAPSLEPTHLVELLALNAFSSKDQTSSSPTTPQRFHVLIKTPLCLIIVLLDSLLPIVMRSKLESVPLLVPPVVAQLIASSSMAMDGLVKEPNA